MATTFYCKRRQCHYSTDGGWWPCEEKALLSMMADGYSYVQMADVLDRSYFSVVFKIKGMNKRKVGRK